MKLLPLLSLSFLGIYVSAAPAEAHSASQYVNETLPSGGYILANGGKLQVVDETQLLQFLESEGISLETPVIDHEWLNFTFVDNHNSTAHEHPARASCSSTTSLVTDKTEKFVDWDVQMSPVVLGAGSGVSATVASGWTIGNSVTVSAGLDLKFIKDRLGGTLGVNYSRTWTSTTSLQYTTSIKDGSAGVWVTRPWTERRYGRTFSGCPGSLVQTGTWVADSHEDGTYDNAKWVSGFITACIKPAPTQGKLTRCHGQGSFI
ncbi:hypothetical protein AB5N19_14570 [Seiridium cardinale]|uniref:Uncharacterized protein n=1 Tax=Seiridium cardinale TaxID=138064 RepID=A0ABR2XQQ6_9PEZI